MKYILHSFVRKDLGAGRVNWKCLHCDNELVKVWYATPTQKEAEESIGNCITKKEYNS